MKDVLIVDDDANIREVVRFALEKAGFKVRQAENGVDALAAFGAAKPDLIVLDILMPEMDGTEVCKAIRRDSRVPIVFLTSMDEEADRIIGLELGGDDYVSKPFSPRELVARVKAVLRRTEAQPDGVRPPRSEGKPVVGHGLLRLDPNTFEVGFDGKPVTLTATEFHLVAGLLAYPGKVYSREELMQKAYDENIVVTDRTIDTHVRRIRKKFAEVGADPVETVHGIGYKIGPCR